MKNSNIAIEIERLISFAIKNKMIEKIDDIQVRNALLDLL
jgi:galactose-1-phosphate uridylyltransferase